MSKHRTHHVAQGQKRDPYHVGTITQHDLLKMDRAARRQAQIDSGVGYGNGSGVHGGDKKTRNRRDRRQNKVDTRNWRDAD